MKAHQLIPISRAQLTKKKPFSERKNIIVYSCLQKLVQFFEQDIEDTKQLVCVFLGRDVWNLRVKRHPSILSQDVRY